VTPIVLLDRDGTINEDRGYVHRWEDFAFTPGAAEAIRALNDAGYRVVVVSNQSGVGRGYYTEQDVLALHQALDAELACHGARIDAYYYCPHHPDAGCACRKPALGLFEQVCLDAPIALEASWMIGDKLDDMEFAVRAGLRGLRVGPEGEVRTLAEAIQIVLGDR